VDPCESTRYLCQSREHPSHGLEIQALAAVDDDDVVAERLAQVLGGLCLACAGRAFGAATTVQVQCRRQRHVTSEGQWQMTKALSCEGHKTSGRKAELALCSRQSPMANFFTIFSQIGYPKLQFIS
jgi:hypothetical protein